MVCRRVLSFLGLLVFAGPACGSSQSETSAPKVAQPVVDETRDCAALVGIVNAGVAVTGQIAQNALTGGNPLLESAQALDVTASEIEATALASEDLLRLGGFYVGLLRLQAKTNRELDQALTAGDEAKVTKLQGDLAATEQQESTILGAINKRCHSQAGQAAPQ